MKFPGKTLLVAFAVLIYGLNLLQAQDHQHLPSEPQIAEVTCFAENKGQWPDQVHFAAELRAGILFLEDNRFTYNFYDSENLHDRYFHGDRSHLSDEMVKHHAFRVNFPQSNFRPNIFSEGKRAEYRNYFRGNDPAKWAGEVGLYDRVSYEGLWDGVDMILYGKDNGLKYDFIVQTESDLQQIAMDYEGVNDIRLEEGRLKIKTTVNEIVEMQPYSYQIINGEKVEIPTEFVLRKNRVSFRLNGKTNPEYPLIIDPTLIFSTYSGSTSDNWGFTATYDDLGNLYASGNVFGTGYPTVTGSYDLSFNGGSIDISITKFNPTGTARIFSTYLGGSNSEQPHSLVVNANHELYLLGTSASTNFPAVNGFDVTHNGGWDIVVCHFNSAGSQLLNSTFMGGSGTDGINISISSVATSLVRNYGDSQRGEVILDQVGNVYVASCSQSTGFPTTPGCLQPGLAGSQDGVVIKFPPTLDTLIWSTYLGGINDDACYGLKVDVYDNVVTTGGTASANFPTTPGSYKPAPGGSIDGFIAKISSNGTAMLASTFLGTSSVDQSYFVELDKDNDVYVVGQTQGAYPVTAGVYSNPGSAQFISKLSSNLSTLIYSTRFGSTNGAINISPTAFLVDVCEYVYVSGWGGNPNFFGNTNGMPITPATAFKTTTDGQDLYFAVFEKDLVSLDFATYYGGNGSREHVDGGTSRFDRKAVIYQAVCAGCGANSLFPTTPGVVSPNNMSNNCNEGAMKIEFPLPGILADFTPNPSSPGCQPHTVSFTNNSIGGTGYTWIFGDGTSSTQFSPTHTFQNPGTYNVLLVAYDPNSCNVWDTATKVITVLPKPTITLTADSVTCTNVPIQIHATGGVSYAWNPHPSFVSSTNVQNPVVNPTGPTTYTVTGTGANGCTATASITIQTFPAPPNVVINPAQTTICKGDSVQLQGSGNGTYSWTNASTLSSSTIANPYAFPTVSTQYILTVTDGNNCKGKDTAQVNVSQVQANAGPDKTICLGDTTSISGSGASQVNWSPNNNLSSTNTATTQAWPGTSSTYYLLVTDVFGCTSLDSMRVTVNPLPVVTANPDTTICLRESVTLQGSGGSTYLWSPGATLNSATNQNPVATPFQTTTYTLTATDQNGCRNTDQLTVTVLPLPPADAGADQVICEDSSIQLSASGGVAYSWTPSASLTNASIPNPVATPPVSTNFIVTVTGANGCKEVDTVYISVTPTPVVNVNPDRDICKGEVMRLLASGPTSLIWSTGETTPIIYVNPDTTTTYSVSGMANGCLTKANTVTITVHDTFPQANFLADPDTGWMPLEVQFANQSQGHVSSYWLFGDRSYSALENPVHIFGDTGRFVTKLVVTNEFGCTDTARKVIIVKGDFSIFVPNAFTPNGDNTNDYFSIQSIGIKTFIILIFDRWGQLLYESNDKNFQWNGKFKDNDCQEEVYTWAIQATSYLGHKVKQAGTVTLLR
ncbi:MAG: gliding motility-associated C-terminal domain-containing protein [Bacteroidia bacterium]|nr:gliding motility-associated C-terminal domain-containing protein [Bacteroidia bacterium]